jgi:hypothetical protein
VLFAQKSPSASHPRPAPQISGRLLETNGAWLTIGHWREEKFETFTGKVNSTCMLPAPTKSGESKPLDLSTIPAGTSVTLFYVSRSKGKQLQNVVLAMRFDAVRRGSDLPQGVSIPCFKAAGQTGR